MMPIKVGVVMAGLLAATALGTIGSPVGQAAPPTCWVRNATQDLVGHSFNAVARDARDGDLLLVRGTCEADGDSIRIDTDLVIRGVGTDRAILTGQDRHRVLRVRPGAVVVLWRLVIEHGRLEGQGDILDNGGGILNRGTLTVVDSIIRRNTVEGLGGGIFNFAPACRGGTCRDASLTLIDTLVSGNQARWGAGIHNNGSYEGGDARLTMHRSRVRNNSGSGIYNWGSAVLEDSVVEGNREVGIDNSGPLILRRSQVRANSGGGIANLNDDEVNNGTVLLADSAVSANTTSGQGGGIRNRGGRVTLRRSLVTGNTAAGKGGGIFSVTWFDFLPARIILEDGSSVTANTSGDVGGGIFNRDGVVRVRESDVTGNTPDDCVGTTAC